MDPIVLVHAGSGSPREWSDGCVSAAEAGAVAPTCIGEEIMRRLSAFRVYALLERGRSPDEAVEEAVASSPSVASFGVIAVSADGHGEASNRDMAVGVARP